MKTQKTIMKFDKATLKARVEAEQALYKSRTTGMQDDWDAVAPLVSVFGGQQEVMAKRRLVLGAIVEFRSNYVHQMLDDVVAKIAEGYTRPNTAMALDTAQPMLFTYFLVKPEAEQAADLKQIAKEEEERYNAEIDAHNAVVEAEMVEQLLAERAEAERQAQATKQRDAREAAQAEVKAALGLK